MREPLNVRNGWKADITRSHSHDRQAMLARTIRSQGADMRIDDPVKVFADGVLGRRCPLIEGCAKLLTSRLSCCLKSKILALAIEAQRIFISRCPLLCDGASLFKHAFTVGHLRVLRRLAAVGEHQSKRYRKIARQMHGPSVTVVAYVGNRSIADTCTSVGALALPQHSPRLHPHRIDQ